MLPFNRKSRLLAPTENVNAPSGLRHPCATTSHTERSYRDSVIVTVSLCPTPKRTPAKPRSTLGGSPASEGKCRYSYGICTRFKYRCVHGKIESEEGAHLTTGYTAGVLHLERDFKCWPVQPQRGRAAFA